MDDMNKEIIFRDGWTLEDGSVSDYTAACAFDVIILGYRYGLKLEEFFHNSEMIGFEWRGTKQAITDWYKYVSVNMCRESEEKRNATLQVISSK